MGITLGLFLCGLVSEWSEVRAPAGMAFLPSCVLVLVLYFNGG